MRNFYNFCARVRKAFLRDDYLYHQIAYFTTVISIIIVLLVIVLYPEIVKAEETSYRCGNSIVSVGDSIRHNYPFVQLWGVYSFCSNSITGTWKHLQFGA